MMRNMFNKFIGGDVSIVIISIFILILPIIINIHISDMVLSIRYLALSVLIFILYLSNVKKGINIYVFKSPIIIIILLLLFINILSSIYHDLTPDALVSLYRLFTLVSLTIFFSGIFGKLDYLLIAKSVLFFCLISLLIYFWQFFIAIINERNIVSSVEGISATMGNKNLLGSILFLSFPFLFYVYQLSNKIWKVLVFITLILILCCLFLIQSKAVLLGLFFMSVSLAFFTFRTHSKVVLSGLVIASFVVAVLFSASPKMFTHFIGEVNQVISKKERVENNRTALYLKTIEMIKESPFLGVGPGNWRKEFPKYGLKNTIGQKGNSFVQRPHSDFLWFFSEGGLLSGAFYILMFIFLLKESLLFYLNMKDEKRYFFLVLFSTILGYVSISMFDFPSERPSHNLFLSIILGIIIGERMKKRTYYYKNNKLFGIILMCLFSVNIAFASIRYKGNLHVTTALKYKSIGDWDRMIGEIKIAYNPYFFDIDNTSTPLYWYYGLAHFNKGEVNIAFDYFKKAYVVNPYHLHVINNLASCYGFNNDYDKAIELYKKCISISPRFEDAALNLASIYSYQQRDEEAIDILLAVRDFKTESGGSLSEAYIYYFNTIFKKLVEKRLIEFGNVNEVNKFNIFVSDRSTLYTHLKNIYLMRESGVAYHQIIKSYKL